MTLPRSLDDLRGLRAARWVRESRREQEKHHGPDAQRWHQDEAIARHELVDTGISWQVASSGLTIGRHAAFAEMLERAGRDYDVLLVAYVSRIARHLETAVLTRRQLHEAGAAILFCDEGVLSSNEAQWEEWARNAVESEAYSRRLSRRVTEGYAAKRRRFNDQGGNAPFGFRRLSEPPRLLEPDPAKGPGIRTIFEASAAGMADRDVAALANLSLHVVRGVLTSPLYVGRLRDGSSANWPPLVDLATWNRAQANRARRATMAGRPSSPSRPYALSTVLHCASCGRRLKGDTGYYRHPDACAEFRAAKPVVMGRWRRDGKGYRREQYEAVVGELLERVSLAAPTLASAVGEVVAQAASVDRLALARVERERAAAVTRYMRDRDTEALERTMGRLDEEQAEAERPAAGDGIDATDARRYLEQLAETWEMLRDEPGRGRRMLAEALFERIDVLGFRSATVHLTDVAARHGLAAVLPSRLELSVGRCRGGRI